MDTITPDKEYAFTNLPVPKTLARFMFPTVISQLAFLLLNLADAFFVGRTGDMYQVSAMTITFPVIMMMNCVTTIFATGGNANIAVALGVGDREQARRTAVFSLYTATGIVVVYALAVYALQKPVFRLLRARDHSIGFCEDYLFWALVGSSIPFSLQPSHLPAVSGRRGKRYCRVRHHHGGRYQHCAGPDLCLSPRHGSGRRLGGAVSL